MTNLPHRSLPLAKRLGRALDQRPELLLVICETLATSPEALAGWQSIHKSSGTPSLGEFADLCRATGLSATWLLGIEGDDDTPLWSSEPPNLESLFDQEAVSAVAALVRRFTRAIESAEIPPKQKFALMHGLLSTPPSNAPTPQRPRLSKQEKDR
jgi:hypothetical protein